ncbi:MULTISPECIES: HNH endonuclease [Pseudofrankia]|uniref:HNH endonuclease n=1 Tax=Pseudofrankia TaxID=2994363 RepID=UPI002FF8A3B0
MAEALDDVLGEVQDHQGGSPRCRRRGQRHRSLHEVRRHLVYIGSCCIQHARDLQEVDLATGQPGDAGAVCPAPSASRSPPASGLAPLHRQRSATVNDRQPIRVDHPHKELITRLLAEICEVCQRAGEVEVHHVRTLKDLGTSGPAQPRWAATMANRRRITLVLCASCHGQIHTRQPAIPLTQ